MPKKQQKQGVKNLPVSMGNRAAQLTTRAGQPPQSLDEVNRSVRFVAATENPVSVWGEWDLISEILLMDGVQLPASVPLLDSHTRKSVDNVLGSFGDFVVEGGTLLGTASFSTTAEDAYTKVKEGHVTDVSIGYEVLQYQDIAPAQTVEIAGRNFTGPVRVVTSWRLAEVSLCPIGADSAAKARSQKRGENMPNRNPNQQRADGGEPAGDGQSICQYLVGTECTLPEGPRCSFLTDAGCSKSVANSNDDEGDVPSPDDATRGENGEPAPATGGADGGDAGQRSAVQLERRRISEITALCDNFGVRAEQRQQFVTDGTTVDAVKNFVLSNCVGNMNQTGARFNATHISMGASESSKVRDAVRDGLLLRVGATVAKPVAGASEFRGMTMREIAREMLHRAGGITTGDARMLMGRALTTTDLPILLTETMGRVLLDAWASAETTWQRWCAVGDLNDFRPYMAASMSIPKLLEKVKEGGEYQYVSASEEGEQLALASYGHIVPITRQALINDDLLAFTQAFTNHGQSAAFTINKMAYGVLSKNATMRDGNALFSTAHGNLLTGGGTPTVSTVGAAVTAMKKQRDSSNNAVRINPQYFLAPTALETASESFFASDMVGTSAEPNVRNIYSGTRFERIYDVDLDDESGSDWYLAGGQGTSVRVFFLSGAREPRVEQQSAWKTDAVEVKISLDTVAAPVSHYGLAKSEAFNA